MPLPVPKLGLVVCYGFVWAGSARRTPPDAGKDRPCMIVDLERYDEPAPVGRSVVRVTYLSISHVAPRGVERAVSLPPRVALHLGLTSERSYLYTSYAVEDDWPFDVTHVPGSADRFDYWTGHRANPLLANGSTQSSQTSSAKASSLKPS